MLRSILLADSDSQSREKFSTILCSIGHKTECIANCDDILSRLQAEKPHLFIIEQGLISEESCKALRKIQENDWEMQIMLLAKDSSRVDMLSKIQGIGVAGIVEKNFSSHYMFKAILQIVREPNEKVEAGKYSNLGKIMFVDDRSEVRAPAMAFLKFRGFDAHEAADGNQALMLIKNEKPKLVILDVRMPGMDGLTVLGKIKELDKSIHVVMLSGLDDEDTVKESHRLGACDFLLKPFDFRTLEALVLSILVTAKYSAA